MRRARLPHRNGAAGLEPQPVRTLGKAPGIKGDHFAAAVACRKVKRVRKVQTVPQLSKSRLNQIAVLDRDIGKTKKMLERIGDQAGFAARVSRACFLDGTYQCSGCDCYRNTRRHALNGRCCRQSLRGNWRRMCATAYRLLKLRHHGHH